MTCPSSSGRANPPRALGALLSSQTLGRNSTTCSPFLQKAVFSFQGKGFKNKSANYKENTFHLNYCTNIPSKRLELHERKNKRKKNLNNAPCRRIAISTAHAQQVLSHTALPVTNLSRTLSVSISQCLCLVFNTPASCQVRASEPWHNPTAKQGLPDLQKFQGTLSCALKRKKEKKKGK